MKSKAKKGLGKGLDALISNGGGAGPRVQEVDIHLLKPNPKQPREHFDEPGMEEMVRSISASGILQPILARPCRNEYEIIAGERRWRAAQRAGLLRVPVIVRDVEDSRMLELALIENLQRRDLNPVEEARAFQVLLEDLHLTQEEVSRRVGKDRATVANTLRLLQLPRSALEALEQGRITAGHAKAILSMKQPGARENLLAEIISKGLTVRQAEKYRPRNASETHPKDPHTLDAQNRLSHRIGLQVDIARRGKGGRLVIRFRNETELDHLFSVLLDHGGSL